MPVFLLPFEKLIKHIALEQEVPLYISSSGGTSSQEEEGDESPNVPQSEIRMLVVGGGQ